MVPVIRQDQIDLFSHLPYYTDQLIANSEYEFAVWAYLEMSYNLRDV